MNLRADLTMDQIERIDVTDWAGRAEAKLSDHAVDALEGGSALRLALPFALDKAEARILHDAVLSGDRKNVSYDSRDERLKGASDDSELRNALLNACRRYQRQTVELAGRLFPPYRDALDVGRTSFRPAEIAGRVPKSWRKDDLRLHVDAFPASPVHGRRMLRLFTNVNPSSAARHWQLGETFPAIAEKFLPRVPKYSLLTARMLATLKVTKTVRSRYDHCMLHIHDSMKGDLDYQRIVSREDVHFAPGETWIIFSDQVSHAVRSGRFVFEQTIYLPVESQRFPERSPLRVLERMVGRALI
jgi:hypothetical protein